MIKCFSNGDTVVTSNSIPFFPFILLFFLLAGRAGWLSVVETRGGILGDDQSWRDLKFPGARGVILDRGGAQKARSAGCPGQPDGPCGAQLGNSPDRVTFAGVPLNCC